MGMFKLGSMTMRSLFSKPETCCYPTQTKPIPEGLKGHIEVDIEHCILCGICQKRCPSGAITVDRDAGTWSIDRFRCVQCGSCTRECPKGCLSMHPHYQPPAPEKHTDVFSKPVEDEEALKAKEAEKAAKIEAAKAAKAAREANAEN